MKTLKNLQLFVLVAVIAGFISCSSDDDVAPIDDPNGNSVQMGSLTLANLPLVEGKVMVENLTMPADGWIVVRRDDGHNRPVMSEIISIPEEVLADNYSGYSIQLKENLQLIHGERLWVNLHIDDDGDEQFSEADMPLGIFDPFSGYTLISDSFIVDLRNP